MIKILEKFIKNKFIDFKISNIVNEFNKINYEHNSKIEALNTIKLVKVLKDNSKLKTHKKKCIIHGKIKYNSGLITLRKYNCIKYFQCPHCKSYFFNRDFILDLINRAKNELKNFKNDI